MHVWSPVDLLPGLYAGFLGGLLAAVLRRWFDAPPLRVLAGFAVAIAVLLGPELCRGQILLPLDSLRGHVPFTQLEPTVPHGNILQGDLIELVVPAQNMVRDALFAGRWPLWNPRVGAGMPVLADPQSQALQPLALAGLAFEPVRAAGIVAALRIWTALLFMFVLLRAQGLSIGAAFVGAVAYGLSGFLLLWLGWPLANTAALLPALLYGIVRVDRWGQPRDVALLTVAATTVWLAGHPETILYAALFALAFLLDRVRERPAGERWPLARRAAIAAIVSACLAAPVLATALDYLPHTLRASRIAEHTPAAMVASSSESPGGLPPSGGSDLARRWLPILAPNAYGNSRYIYYWGYSNTNEDASGFVGTAAILAALLTIGARPRLRQENLAVAGAVVCLLILAEPLGHLGRDSVFGALLGSRRVLLVLALCLAYLAACTVERFARGNLRLLPVAIATVVLGSVLAWAYWTHRDPSGLDRLAILRFGWLRWQGRCLIVAGLLLAATPLRLRPLACAVLGLCVGGELVLAHLPANPPSPPRLAFPFTPPVGFLFAHRHEGRMAALGRAFPPNLPSLYGLSDARVYSPAAPAAYLHLLAPLIASWWGELPLLGAPANPLYARLGVRYLLTAPHQMAPPPWKLTFADSTGWVYRQPTITPPFAAIGPGASTEPLAASRIEDATLTLVARAQATPRALSTSLFQDGGWRLLIDGQPARSVTPGILLGAELPAGARRVDLLYRPRFFIVGCLLTGLGILGFLLSAVEPPGPGRGSTLDPA